MAGAFLLDAVDFAGDLMPLVQPPASEAERFLNIYLASRPAR